MRWSIVAVVVLAACSKRAANAPPDAGPPTTAGAASLQLPPGFVYQPEGVLQILEGLKKQNPAAQAVARTWLNAVAQQRLTLTAIASPPHARPGREALLETLARTVAGLKGQGLTLDVQQVDPGPEQLSYLLRGAAGNSSITTRGILAFDLHDSLRNWAVTCSVPVDRRDDCTAPVATFAVDLTQTPLKAFAPAP